MEPLSHYHCEIYRCKHVPINLYHASTCTSTCTINKCINHVPTCTKQSVINLYHKQVHPTMYQVCTNHVSTTHKYVPTSSTIHLMYVPTHQLLFSTMYSTCTSTKIPHQFHHPNMICISIADLVYMVTVITEISSAHGDKNSASSKQE
jgi:hypothetical protein